MERVFLTQACASSKVETRRKNGAYTQKVTQLLSYSITQFISRPLHLELGYKLKVYFLYYIFIIINI